MAVSYSVTRPAPDADDADDIEALRKELRRLCGENLRLEENKAELEKAQRRCLRISDIVIAWIGDRDRSEATRGGR